MWVCVCVCVCEFLRVCVRETLQNFTHILLWLLHISPTNNYAHSHKEGEGEIERELEIEIERVRERDREIE
jgi:hypothetical protein